MARNQLLLLAHEWYMNPNAQLPAYEWNFSDVNPPVQAWAALAVFRIDGVKDFDFLARVFNKLLINFTWWVNREDARGDNIFQLAGASGFPSTSSRIESFRHLHNFFGGDLTVELPTGSGIKANLSEVAAELERRLLSLFLLDANGRRPAHGANPRFQNDPTWRDSLLFYEYFHGETGEGLGASHQTGWTALAGALVAREASAQPKI
jgi:hypothetical protein